MVLGAQAYRLNGAGDWNENWWKWKKLIKNYVLILLICYFILFGDTKEKKKKHKSGLIISTNDNNCTWTRRKEKLNAQLFLQFDKYI